MGTEYFEGGYLKVIKCDHLAKPFLCIDRRSEDFLRYPYLKSVVKFSCVVGYSPYENALVAEVVDVGSTLLSSFELYGLSIHGKSAS